MRTALSERDWMHLRRTAGRLALLLLCAAGSAGLPAAETQADRPPAGHTGDCVSCHGEGDGNRWVFDGKSSQILFQLSNYGFSTLTGQVGAIGGGFVFDPDAPARSRVKATIEVAAIDMHDELLNAVLRSERFFDAARYPLITFEGTSLVETPGGGFGLDGLLTIRGITRPAHLEVTLNKIGMHPLSHQLTAGFSARTVIRRSDFGMDLGAPAIADEVTILIEVQGDNLKG